MKWEWSELEKGMMIMFCILVERKDGLHADDAMVGQTEDTLPPHVTCTQQPSLHPSLPSASLCAFPLPFPLLYTLPVRLILIGTARHGMACRSCESSDLTLF